MNAIQDSTATATTTTDTSATTTTQAGGAAAPASPATVDNSPLAVDNRTWEAAQAKLAGQQTSTAPNPPAGETSSASSGAVDPNKPGTDGATKTDGGKPAGEAQATGDGLVIPAIQQALAIPGHWNPELKAKFGGLPSEAQPMFLEMYQGMQDAYAAREQQFSGLLNLQQQFQQNPRAVLEQLAQEAKLPVWFEQPTPKGEIPKFETMEEYNAWRDKENQRQIQEALTRDKEEREASQRVERARIEFRGELERTATKYPDFAAHREGIMTALAEIPGISVEQAYHLATYQGLRQLAIEGQAAKAERDKLKQEVERMKVRATHPGPAGLGNGESVPVSANADPWSGYFDKAMQKVAAQTH